MWFNMAATLSFGGLMNFGEKSSSNSADNWQDANTALAELDKGTLLCRGNYFVSVFVPSIVTVFWMRLFTLSDHLLALEVEHKIWTEWSYH